MTAEPSRIAVVGMACRYPDAETPEQLWQNVLAGRRAFRRLPDERMRHEDYYSPDPAAPDRHYARKAAVLEGFEFDRVEHRVAGSTFRATDMTHWLALDTVAQALRDAGFPEGGGLPAATTGAVLGNSLTGEFSRANLMRLRWPYVRRTVGAALREQGWSDAELAQFLTGLEERYKQPFPPIDEDSLAGGLANTIAGRICNHFDLGGGGFTVDGACSSSLLSVATACNALASGQWDVAIAGGVDLSIDPFEVVGFAKTGALATGEMRVYDRRSNGFWPGEGCGAVVLMRNEDALAQGRFRYAVIAGWGWSSDGRGGMTRPEASGHRLALDRAYRSAGFGLETVSYLEGHGTGTAVGDATELRALSEARRAADPDAPPAALGTVKGNLGHTKAAAGIAGLLKAVLVVRHQIIPPATGHHDPHPELLGERPALRVPRQAEVWPEGAPRRAGVSSMGFGGINAHIVVEHADGVRRTALPRSTARLVRSRQDCELLLVDADDTAALRGRLARLAALAGRLSYAELGDLAASLEAELAGRTIRAAVVASSPEQAEERFTELLARVDGGARAVLDPAAGLFLGRRTDALPRIGFLFPGQGAGRSGEGGALRARFAAVDELYREQGLPVGGDQVATEVAQPRIVTASVAGLRVLDALGVTATSAAGHSLGELTALHWAGAMDEAGLLRTAAARGRVMAAASDGGGAMASIAAAPASVEPLLDGEPVVIAGYNGPRQTVVSGPADAVARVSARAVAQGLGAQRINVSHAFHSPAVAPAGRAFAKHLAEERFEPLARRVVSTVTGAPLPRDTDVAELLTRQVLAPVRFTEAVKDVAAESDLLLELGPGRILSGLAAETVDVPVIALDTDSVSLAGLFHGVAAAWVLGAPVRHSELFRDRFTRPLPLDKEFRFLANPCESAPDGHLPLAADAGADADAVRLGPAGESAGAPPAPAKDGASSLDVLMRLAAARAELPPSAISPDTRPLDELHLSSITVGQIMNEAARELGVDAIATTSAFATSTLAELAALLDELSGTALASDADSTMAVAGVAPWVRAFSVDLVEAEPGKALGQALSAEGGGKDWAVFASDRHPLAGPLAAALRDALDGGVLLCLPADCDDEHAALMLSAARAALHPTAPAARFVAVGDRRGAAGLAKTLHLEAPATATTVVTLPLNSLPPLDELTRRIVADVAATSGFSEVHYDAAGVRRVPVLRALPPDVVTTGTGTPARPPLTATDVLLVTGGGKGITAECALSLARETGCAIGLLGRSDPETDRELAANLGRMAAAGVRFHYSRADVTSAGDTKAAVNDIRDRLGPVTAVLHGAGRNEPRALADLDEASFRRTLAVKIAGLEAVLAAVDPADLRLVVAFGSIIGRAGLRGEADYATANDWLTERVTRLRQDLPGCRCIALEWSVWSGTGMGERLGVLESLLREGIEPIPADEGVAMLRRVLADPDVPDTLVVMGRAGGLPTISLQDRELPLLRFVERVQAHYPGVELVADSELSAATDPYLADHLLDGTLLLPAVLGMEAMAQAAAALTGRTGSDAVPALEDAEFLRPVAVPPDGTTTVRVAVLATGPDTVRAVIRSSETDFRADHFRAVLRYGPHPELPEGRTPPEGVAPSLDPARDMYGPVLFQGARFQRLTGYRHLAAKECVADISTSATAPWFAGFLPSDLVLADPGTRDALMHSIQACVPDATLLPVGIERLHLADPLAAGRTGSVVLHAVERSRDGDTYVYDLDVRDEHGAIVERWTGLTLRAVRKLDGSGPWEPALLGPYLERRVEAVLAAPVRIAVHPDGDGAGHARDARRARTADALGQALGHPVTLRHRPDGRPEVDGGPYVSASHGAGVTLAVAGQRPVACDVQRVAERGPDEWEGLLGTGGLTLARLIAAEYGEDLSLAAGRVWGATECLRKSGRAHVELTVDAAPGAPDRWVVLRSGAARIATVPAVLGGAPEPAVFALLAEKEG
ncbi:type I polyketide synthase [Streptomyces ficellus]|uniref:Type I polyketide synthase n=1 Tax=Streptomyces ficellus TaxID=1977088 RepID=A0ABT7Z119_9ACTN|nr:type I polyketide synthase [Streptomyces ficellus]MDN3292811.1 type I polyketide synthase [Streptomyces ficellus]